MIKIIVIRKKVGKCFKSRFKSVLSKILGWETEEKFELENTRISVNIFNGKVDGDERIRVFNPVGVAKEENHQYYVTKVRRIDIEDGVLWLNKKGTEMYGQLFIFYGVVGYCESPKAEILTDNEDIVFVPR